MNKKDIKVGKIEQAYDNKNWNLALKYLKQELTIRPRDIWVLTLLSSVLYEMHMYDEALYYAKKAYGLNKNDILVLWHYAGVLHMLGKCNEAIRLYKKLLQLASKTDPNDKIEIKLARELINDSKYRIGGCYLMLEKYDLSQKWFKMYLKNRKSNVRTHYTLRDVRDKFEIIEKETGIKIK